MNIALKMDIPILVRSYCLCACSSLKQWSSKYADKINGTDGTIAPPFLVDEHFKAYLYSTDICRSALYCFIAAMTDMLASRLISMFSCPTVYECIILSRNSLEIIHRYTTV